MIQSHLLQVLALLAMEPPAALDARDVRDRKAQVLRATRRVGRRPGRRCSRRARYTAGELDGRQLPAYVDEEGIDPQRRTETLAEVVLAVDTWRWAGVPFRLRSGKALGRPRKEVVITFKQPPLASRRPAAATTGPDRLRIGVRPGAGCELDFNINGPGDPLRLDPSRLEAAAFGAGDLPAYGEVLAGVLDGDPTLSVRGDTAVQCWRIVEPVLTAWRDGRGAAAGVRGRQRRPDSAEGRLTAQAAVPTHPAASQGSRSTRARDRPRRTP